MPTPLENILTMNEEELEELNKKMKKRMIKKVLISIGTSVVVHFASEFIIAAIDKKRNEKHEIEE